MSCPFSDTAKKEKCEGLKGRIREGRAPAKNGIDKTNEHKKRKMDRITQTSEGGAERTQESSGSSGWLQHDCACVSEVSLRCVQSLPWIAARVGRHRTPTGKRIKKDPQTGQRRKAETAADFKTPVKKEEEEAVNLE